jgi:hypothetical protein
LLSVAVLALYRAPTSSGLLISLSDAASDTLLIAVHEMNPEGMIAFGVWKLLKPRSAEGKLLCTVDRAQKENTRGLEETSG